MADRCVLRWAAEVGHTRFGGRVSADSAKSALFFIVAFLVATPFVVKLHWRHDSVRERGRWRLVYATAYALFGAAVILMWSFPGIGGTPWIVAFVGSIIVFAIGFWVRERDRRDRGERG